MRRLVVLGVLLAMMFAITTLQTDQDSAHDPMILAAIGFVILAAFTVSEIGKLLKLPQVSGYIVAGLVLGPAAANILSSEVVIEMKMFNTLALGLIATGAGLELDVSRLRKVWKTLIATIGVKTILSASLVIATTIGIQTATGALVLPAEGQLLSLALVLGVFSLTTSPAIVMAVLDETKAKGRMTDLALGAAVLKDLVVIVSLATVVAISRTLLVPGAELEVSTLVNVGKEIVSSVAAGAVLGVLLILYIRYVHAEMLLFVAAMILVVSELGMSLHLEILLVFITAGFVVRNFSRHEEELASPLSLVSLPVFVLFFTNAGASVDLRTTLRILPLALGICVVRAFAFWVSARVGGIVGREEPAVKNNAWLGYLPQAGVTLGLVGLAAQQLPELAGPIASTGMAMVAINLLIGPITLRQALRLTGDIEGGVPSISETVPQSKRPSAVPEVLVDEVKARADDAISNAKSAIEAMESEVLRALVQGTQEQLSKAADEFFEESLKPWSESFRASLSKALASSAKDDGFSNWLVAFPPPDTAHQGQVCRGFCERLHTVIPPLPEHISASMEPRHRQVDPSSPYFKRVWKKLRSSRHRNWRRMQRDIPVRLAARVCLEPSLSGACADILSSWCAMEARMLAHINAYAAGVESRQVIEEKLEKEACAWLGSVRANLDRSLFTGLQAMADALSNVGSVDMPTSSLRYSVVEPRVREALQHLQEDPGIWAGKLEAARMGPVLAACLARIDHMTRVAVDQHVLLRASSAVQGMMPVIVAVRERIQSVRAMVQEGPEAVDMGELRQSCKTAYSPPMELRVERSGSRLRPSASVHHVTVTLRDIVAELPEQLTVIQRPIALHDVIRPREASTRTVRLRDVATQQVLWTFLPTLDECVQETSTILARANAQVRGAIDRVNDVLEGTEEGEGLSDTEELFAVVKDGEARLIELEEQIRSSTDTLRERVSLCLEAASTSMQEASAGRIVLGLASSAEVRVSDRAKTRLAEMTAPLRLRLMALRIRLNEALGKLQASEISQDIRLRLQKSVLDAASIRAYVQRWQSAIEMPDTYTRFFDGEPVREHRRFTANQRAHEALIVAERAWLEGGPSSALVVGKYGSGRTSLLNLCELEMSPPRLVRLNRANTPRSAGLVGAIAVDLGCRPSTRHLVHTLGQTRTLVIIDDFEHWVTPDAAGVRDLERFLNLIIRTRKDVFWLASTTNEALRLIEEAASVRQAFGHVVTLEPLKLEELMRAVEGRHELSGYRITYPRSLNNRVLGRLQRTSDKVLFFRNLLSYSEGNLAQALGVWIRSVRLDEDGALSLELPRGLNTGLPFIEQMNVREVAVLVQLARFGPMTVGEVSAGIGVDRDAAERHVEFLRMAGLVELVDGTQKEYQLSRAVRPPVLMGLRGLGAWS